MILILVKYLNINYLPPPILGIVITNKGQYLRDIRIALILISTLQNPELANEMRRLAIIKLYELGKLSSGIAAQMLGITRVAFLQLLGTYHVPILGDPAKDQLEQDLMNA